MRSSTSSSSAAYPAADSTEASATASATATSAASLTAQSLSAMTLRHAGWLVKSPPMQRTSHILRARWRRRYFVLRETLDDDGGPHFYLAYFSDERAARNGRKLKGVIDLADCQQVDAGLTVRGDNNHHFQRYEHLFSVRTSGRIYYLAADSAEEMSRWVSLVCSACGLRQEGDDDAADGDDAKTDNSSFSRDGEGGFPSGFGAGSRDLKAPPRRVSEPSSAVSDFQGVGVGAAAPMPLSSVPQPSSSPYIHISTCYTGQRQPPRSNHSRDDDQQNRLNNNHVPPLPPSPRSPFELSSFDVGDDSVFLPPSAAVQPPHPPPHEESATTSLSTSSCPTFVRPSSGVTSSSSVPPQPPGRPPKPPHLSNSGVPISMRGGIETGPSFGNYANADDAQASFHQAPTSQRLPQPPTTNPFGTAFTNLSVNGPDEPDNWRSTVGMPPPVPVVSRELKPDRDRLSNKSATLFSSAKNQGKPHHLQHRNAGSSAFATMRPGGAAVGPPVERTLKPRSELDLTGGGGGVLGSHHQLLPSPPFGRSCDDETISSSDGGGDDADDRRPRVSSSSSSNFAAPPPGGLSSSTLPGKLARQRQRQRTGRDHRQGHPLPGQQSSLASHQRSHSMGLVDPRGQFESQRFFDPRQDEEEEEEQIYFYMPSVESSGKIPMLIPAGEFEHASLAYIDLDLPNPTRKNRHPPSSAGPSSNRHFAARPPVQDAAAPPPLSSNSSSAYKRIDFIKTEAFNRTRHKREEEYKKKEGEVES